MRRSKWRLVRYGMLATFTMLLVYLMNTQINTINYKNRRKTTSQEPIVLMINAAEYIGATLRGNGNGNGNGNDDDTFARHAFNVFKSDRLPSDRAIPDARHPSCRDLEHELGEYETTSVVVVFYNEARSALLRTVVSILNRTPLDLLHEIILIDDFSDDETDGSSLSSLPKVRLIRNPERQGLIKSRNTGADQAQGDYLMFLDSHTEVNTGWLEPLMAAVYKNGLTVASPVIDVIDLDTFQYRSSSAQLKGGFDWSLHFKWIQLREDEKAVNPIESFPSPIIAGGFFLINKIWFRRLGNFDPGLRIWGGESLEISLKSWLCGGRVEVLPCSRVGHVFRKKHPYSFPDGNGNTYMRNTKRVAEVWLGEHKRFFYEARPNAREVDAGSLEVRTALRDWLQCNSFQWYLDTIFPELRLPNEENTAFGELKQESLCLTANTKDSEINLTECTESSANQRSWSFSIQTGEVKHGAACLTVSSGESKPYLATCTQTITQKWDRLARSIVHTSSGRCLESGLASQVSLSVCRHAAVSQQWDFTVELQTQDHAPVHFT